MIKKDDSEGTTDLSGSDSGWCGNIIHAIDFTTTMSLMFKRKKQEGVLVGG